VALERRRLELPVQPRDPRPRDLISLVRSKLWLNDLIERVPIESSSSRLPTGTRAKRSFRFLISQIPLFYFRRRRPDRHGRAQGFGRRRRSGAQQIGDPLEGGEHAVVLVSRRR